MTLSITPLTDAEIASITSSPRIQRWLRDLITQLRTLDTTTSSIVTDTSDITAVADSGAAVGREAMVMALSLARLVSDLEHQPQAISYRMPDAYSITYARSKADIGLQKVENTALSTWPGTTSIATLGTITAGAWQGSVIGCQYGGTGLSSVPANGQIDIGNGSGFTRATLTAGSGVSIANGAGTITISATGSGGTVTSVSVVSANGFAGTVATATTTPTITLTTTVNGILQGNGTSVSAASTTGSGNVVLATSPTLVTPAIGAATGTSLTLTNTQNASSENRATNASSGSSAWVGNSLFSDVVQFYRISYSSAHPTRASQAWLDVASNHDLILATNDTERFRINSSGIKTEAPSGASAAWKLGSITAGVGLTLHTTSYVEVSIGGTVVKLARVN